MSEGILDAIGMVLSMGCFVGMMAALYIFPLFLAWRAWRNGFRGWAWATGIATLFGLGLPVGLVALIVARKPSGPQVECPQCGELSRAVGSVTLERETGEQVGSPILGILALVGGIALCIFAVWMAVALVVDPLPSNISVGSPGVVIGLAISIGASMAGWGLRAILQLGVDKIRVAKYKCPACKHQWRRRADGTEIDVELERKWSDRVVDQSIQALKEKGTSSTARAQAAKTLAKAGDTRAVEPLIETLRDKRWLQSDARRAAAEALGEIGDARAVEPLIQALGAKGQILIQIAAAEALGKIGDARAVEPLIQALKAGPLPVMKALGKIGDARAVEPIIPYLKTPFLKSVPVQAAKALGQIGDARAVEPLIQALWHKKGDVRRAAAEALGKIGDAKAVGALTQALEDKDSSVRKAAGEALEKIEARPSTQTVELENKEAQ